MTLNCKRQQSQCTYQKKEIAKKETDGNTNFNTKPTTKNSDGNEEQKCNDGKIDKNSSNNNKIETQQRWNLKCDIDDAKNQNKNNKIKWAGQDFVM